VSAVAIGLDQPDRFEHLDGLPPRRILLAERRRLRSRNKNGPRCRPMIVHAPRDRPTLHRIVDISGAVQRRHQMLDLADRYPFAVD